jgi:hypothetical protein
VGFIPSKYSWIGPKLMEHEERGWTPHGMFFDCRFQQACFGGERKVTIAAKILWDCCFGD